MKEFLNIVFFLLLIITTSSSIVYSQDKLNLPNIAVYYNPSLTTIHPDFKIYLKSENKATVYFRLYLPELNLVFSNYNYEAKVQIKYIFYKSLLSTDIIDSSSQIITFRKKNIKQTIVTFFETQIPDENCYMVLITKDLYNNKKNIEIIYIDKSEKSDQNFLLLDVESVIPSFYNFVTPNIEYKIVYNQEVDSFLVKKFKPDTALSLPPFSTLKSNFTPQLDSEFYQKAEQNIIFDENSIYVIQNLQNDALITLISNYDNYPLIKTAEKMIYPLEYITTTKEFKDLLSTPNNKIAVDNFWLSTNKDPNIAKTLIKIYYNRVVYANRRFSTTKQGWMTDRGMIYIIFGPPDVLHVADNFQEWIYIDNFTREQVNFIFDKSKVFFSIEDYLLRRNLMYNSYWKDAVNSWKSGKFYVF